MRAVRPVLLAAAVLLAGCNGSNSEPTAVDTNVYTADPATSSYASSLNVNLSTMTKTPSGLYYKDLVTGTGATAAAGFTVRVTYSGRLVNGDLFDTTDGKVPGYFEFLLNAGKVIKGWDEGVQGMKVGGKRQLVIPPSLAYGETGSGSVPGNAILVFEVPLLQVR
ncbi:MAG: FKBP-type peptidyl-prolyl cis-trans isomerase [Gemmatimonadaceae bacterium]|nr:FKBP-type peptidyl-prolyl cis-trans isomerase [Gemmatimonadaceae bacterium]